MKLIIDIDDEDYKRIQDIPNTFNSLTSRAYSAIRKGTPQQTEQEEAEEKQEEKKVESIEDKTWLNFNAILAIYSYYEKTLEDITKEPIPPCFNSICDPKYLKFALDGLEDAMAALTMLYKNILERSGTHGAVRGMQRRGHIYLRRLRSAPYNKIARRSQRTTRGR